MSGLLRPWPPRPGCRRYVGVDPRADGGAAIYHARVSELVHSGRAYARIEAGRVVFKAEVGAVSRYACQLQGVWVHPDLRGRGLSVPAMAAVVRHALRDHADIPLGWWDADLPDEAAQ